MGDMTDDLVYFTGTSTESIAGFSMATTHYAELKRKGLDSDENRCGAQPTPIRSDPATRDAGFASRRRRPA